MIAKYRNYDFFDQDYLEELIRQTLPNCKINNVVPHNAMCYEGGALNPCPDISGVVYYGVVFRGSGDTCGIYDMDLNTFNFGGFTDMPPMLFRSIRHNSISNVGFSGWKIMLENPPVNPSTPAPPIALDVDGVKVWNFTQVTTDYSYNTIALFGAVNANSTFEYKKASDATYLSTPLVKGTFRFKLLLHDSGGASIQEALQWRVKDSLGNVIHSGTTVFDDIPYLPETVTSDATFEYMDLTAQALQFVRPSNIKCYNAGGADIGSPFIYQSALHYRLIKSSVPSTFDIGFTFGYAFTLVDGSIITRTTPDVIKKYGITKVA
ncbi:MAG: hypothetical protein IT249_09480 [Chitinophagaceae bacterium]|nr:hypothetical protein [Chitinophagaceae bacterium]